MKVHNAIVILGALALFVFGTAAQDEPIKIGDVTIDNRIARSSIAGITCGEFGAVRRERLALEVNFAKGGPGLIISSHVPILANGRVLPNYAMIDHDDRIKEWAEVVKAVEAAGSKFFMQLSHSGRQQDIGGVGAPNSVNPLAAKIGHE